MLLILSFILYTCDEPPTCQLLFYLLGIDLQTKSLDLWTLLMVYFMSTFHVPNVLTYKEHRCDIV